jgi:hypothetical protein
MNGLSVIIPSRTATNLGPCVAAINRHEICRIIIVDDAAPSVSSSPEECYMVARIHDAHTSSKKNISGSVAKELLPAGFWENERLVGAL